MNTVKYYSYSRILNKQAFLHKNVITLLHIFKEQKVSMSMSNFQTVRTDRNTHEKQRNSAVLKYIKRDANICIYWREKEREREKNVFEN